MLNVRDISVCISRKEILHGINFTARPGQFTAIVGPNGSGKTTLLKALTGELPYQGTVTLDEQDVARMSPVELATRRGVLAQSAGLSFPFTVLEVVRLGLLSGLGACDENLPRQALARVGLAGFEGRFYHALSGGEQQRCQLARVLVQVWEPIKDNRAAWLFLDEPVSSLDIGHQLAVMNIARDFANGGGGVVAVMHDLNLTAMFADNILLMQSGRAVVQDTPNEVLTNAHLSAAYGCSVRVNETPSVGGSAPFILPHLARL